MGSARTGREAVLWKESGEEPTRLIQPTQKAALLISSVRLKR